MTNNRKIQILSESTLVPLSLVLAICAIVYSFSQVYARVDFNSEKVKQVDLLRSDISKVSAHVHELSGKIDILIFRIQERPKPKKSRHRK